MELKDQDYLYGISSTQDIQGRLDNFTHSLGSEMEKSPYLGEISTTIFRNNSSSTLQETVISETSKERSLTSSYLLAPGLSLSRMMKFSMRKEFMIGKLELINWCLQMPTSTLQGKKNGMDNLLMFTPHLGLDHQLKESITTNGKIGQVVENSGMDTGQDS